MVKIINENTKLKDSYSIICQIFSIHSVLYQQRYENKTCAHYSKAILLNIDVPFFVIKLHHLQNDTCYVLRIVPRT